MHRIQSLVLLVGSLGLFGCAKTIPLPGGKSILSIPQGQATDFAENIGYSRNRFARVSRSTTGHLLFVQFEDSAGVWKVAIVSSSGISLKTLPGESCLSDKGEPVFWLNEPDRSLQFPDGATLCTNIHVGASDARFVALFDINRFWIARVESPLEEVLPIFDSVADVQLMISYKDKLHVFVRGAPEGEPRPDRWFILKRYEYQIEGSTARLLQVQDFYYTWFVMDFDPELNLMYASSWDDMFAHGLLVNTVTEERRDIRFAHGHGYFLHNAVIKQFQEALRGRPVFVPSE